MYKTIKKKEEVIFIEKKSKFIAELHPIKSREEAEETIQSIRKKYYDAKHHCYAYRIKTETETIEKSSDDGEPSGTAGSPMLHVLQKEELFNVLIVVTRYFGGILLGTGGLVRAYTQAMQNAMAKTEVVQEENGYWIELTIPYNELGKCQFYCKKHQAKKPPWANWRIFTTGMRTCLIRFPSTRRPRPMNPLFGGTKICLPIPWPNWKNSTGPCCPKN